MTPPRRPADRRGGPDPDVVRALRARMDAMDEGTPGAREPGRRRVRRALRARTGDDGEDRGSVAGFGPDGPDVPDDAVPDADGPDDAVLDDEDGSEGPWWARAAKPIPVEGGIVARTRRGAIGESWWSRRFLGALEGVLAEGRAARGRTYARKGQVIELRIEPGLIEADVQGSREDPYRVGLALAPVPEADWDRIVDALGSEVGYAARLLAGELPTEIEAVFDAQGASLFPAPGARLVTSCTCPDWENPCKHVAAVCYLVAEAVDRDPFLVLRWRGRDREALLAQLRAHRRDAAAVPDQTAAVAAPAQQAPAHDPPAAQTPSGAPPLAACLDAYWSAGPELAEIRVRPVAAAPEDAVLRQLADGVVEVRGRDVRELLAPLYARLVAGAARRALGARSR